MSETNPFKRYSLDAVGFRLTVDRQDFNVFLDGRFTLIDINSLDLDDPQLLENLRRIKAERSALMHNAYLESIYETLDTISGDQEIVINRFGWLTNAEERYINFVHQIKEEEVEQLIDEMNQHSLTFLYDKSECLAELRKHVERAKKLQQIAQFGSLIKRFPSPLPGEVYLLKSPTSHYKIGYSKHPERRARQIANGLPFPLEVIHTIKTNQMECAEYELHEKYSSKRIDRTEWFCLTDEDVSEIIGIGDKMYPWLTENETVPS